MNRSGHAYELGPAHKVALRLARLFIPGNSGGIVRFGGASRAGTGGSAFRLGLATLEILPQRRAQTPLLPYLLSALWTIVHGRKITTRRQVTEGLRRNRRSLDGARLRQFQPYGKDRRTRGRFPSSAIFASGPALP
jgi:hypothetical protein